MADNKVDALFIGAHPDDIEICAGGTIVKLVKEGKKVGIIDCTPGEMGTRGSVAERRKEAEKAAEILGVHYRENLGMRDGYIRYSDENMLRLITTLRKYQPEMIITHPPFERHTDHEQLNKLVREANFKAGLIKIETKLDGKLQERWRTRKLYYYMQSFEFPRKPDFYVDISEVYDIKVKALEAFETQIYFEGKSDIKKGHQTRLYRPGFMKEKEARAIYFGSLIGVQYAEAFLSEEPVGISSLSNFLDY
ncbi:MAG: bacillithiol biosynthesis deacetylase BshB1 [Candidatus Kapaibacterium sp.]